MSWFKVARVQLRLAVLGELQYRVNLLVQLGQSLIALATGLLALGLVFQQVDRLNGWSAPRLLVVMGTHLLVGGILQSWIQPNMARLIADLREGGLDLLLTRPQDAQLLVSLREFRLWQLVDVLLGGIVLTLALRRLGNEVGAGQALAFALLVTLGVAMLYAVWLMLSASAFWLIRGGDLLEVFSSFHQAGRWPVDLYPPWLRGSLTYVLPMAFAVTLPAETLTRPLEPRALVLAAWLALLLVALSRAVWRAGLRRYAGASS
jgi:ABC-2 type transport system permease protein